LGDELNITKKILNEYKNRLKVIDEVLLKISWVSVDSDFDVFIDEAITLRDEIFEIEVELLIDKLRKKIFNGGIIELSDLLEIESIGWEVPKFVWDIIKDRSNNKI
jgi:hypothetical protein|tara:strand:- start:3167 stop:3484 length:318 start_codon:yes stop_codon:yes gene_type:complete